MVKRQEKVRFGLTRCGGIGRHRSGSSGLGWLETEREWQQGLGELSCGTAERGLEVQRWIDWYGSERYELKRQ